MIDSSWQAVIVKKLNAQKSLKIIVWIEKFVEYNFFEGSVGGF